MEYIRKPIVYTAHMLCKTVKPLRLRKQNKCGEHPAISGTWRWVLQPLGPTPQRWGNGSTDQRIKGTKWQDWHPKHPKPVIWQGQGHSAWSVVYSKWHAKLIKVADQSCLSTKILVFQKLRKARTLLQLHSGYLRKCWRKRTRLLDLLGKGCWQQKLESRISGSSSFAAKAMTSNPVQHCREAESSPSFQSFPEIQVLQVHYSLKWTHHGNFSSDY